MREIIYLVTRDSLKAEKEYGYEKCVSIWEEATSVITDDEMWPGQTDSEGIWMCNRGNEPLAEFTVEDFELLYQMKAPEPMSKFFIRTDCNWEKTE